MNLLQVATTETEVAEMASRIHIVATLMPRPMTHDATNSDDRLGAPLVLLLEKLQVLFRH